MNTRNDTLFQELVGLAEEEMRAYRRVSASTVRALISAASGSVRLREKEVADLKARIAELEAALSQYTDDYNWCYDTCSISRNTSKDALKGAANED